MYYSKKAWKSFALNMNVYFDSLWENCLSNKSVKDPTHPSINFSTMAITDITFPENS